MPNILHSPLCSSYGLILKKKKHFFNHAMIKLWRKKVSFFAQFDPILKKKEINIRKSLKMANPILPMQMNFLSWKSKI